MRRITIPGQPGSAYQCVHFSGVPVAGFVGILLAYADGAAARDDAERLEQVLSREIHSLSPRITADPPHELSDPVSCPAFGPADPTARKVLVLVGDADAPLTIEPFHAPWDSGDPTYAVLPIFPVNARPKTGKLLPSAYAKLNARFWSNSLEEVVPAIFALSGITVEYARIFVSYRQPDAAALGAQLFDELSHRNFDVFLDRYRIPPGVDFQARLTQELGDKSMVLFLESPTFLDSEWVRHEVDVATECQLGIVALHLPGGKAVPGVDEDARIRWNELENSNGIFDREPFDREAILRPDALHDATERIIRAHDRAFARRRQRLRGNLVRTLTLVGADFTVDRSGAFVVRSGDQRREYLVWLTDRPPDLADFHLTHGHQARTDEGVVIGLSRLMEPPRFARLNWLSGVSKMKIVDEGLVLDSARAMKAGLL